MKEKRSPQDEPVSSAKAKRPSRKTRETLGRTASTPVVRHGSLVIPLNPGQSQLLESLISELACPIAVSDPDAAIEIDLPPHAEAPGLGNFLLHQIQLLAEQQARLEALWAL